MKKLNKKGDGGDEDFLAWVVVTFISLFILFIYLVICFGYGSAVSLTPGKNAATVFSTQSDIVSTESFIGFLNSEVVFDGKKEKVVKAVTDSFDLYFETKSSTGVNLVHKYGLYHYNDISSVSRSQMISDGFDSKAIDKIIENNKALADLFKSRLDLYCKMYKFGMPFGLVDERVIMQSSDPLGNMVYYVRKDPFPVDWNPVIKIPFTYREKNASFQYTQLKTCSNGGFIE
jgi:hypothetical protein